MPRGDISSDLRQHKPPVPYQLIQLFDLLQCFVTSVLLSNWKLTKAAQAVKPEVLLQLPSTSAMMPTSRSLGVISRALNVALSQTRDSDTFLGLGTRSRHTYHHLDETILRRMIELQRRHSGANRHQYMSTAYPTQKGRWHVASSPPFAHSVCTLSGPNPHSERGGHRIQHCFREVKALYLARNPPRQELEVPACRCRMNHRPYEQLTTVSFCSGATQGGICLLFLLV